MQESADVHAQSRHMLTCFMSLLAGSLSVQTLSCLQCSTGLTSAQSDALEYRALRQAVQTMAS